MHPVTIKTDIDIKETDDSYDELDEEEMEELTIVWTMKIGTNMMVEIPE